MRLVCPKCKNDDRLYSLESADLMYPITANSDLPRVHYADDLYIVLDEGTKFEGRIYCRSDDEELRHEDLLLATGCLNCGRPIYRQQNSTEQILTLGGVDTWKDAADIPLCPGTAEPHRIAG